MDGDLDEFIQTFLKKFSRPGGTERAA
jgi:hypothetical protein